VTVEDSELLVRKWIRLWQDLSGLNSLLESSMLPNKSMVWFRITQVSFFWSIYINIYKWKDIFYYLLLTLVIYLFIFIFIFIKLKITSLSKYFLQFLFISTYRIIKLLVFFTIYFFYIFIFFISFLHTKFSLKYQS